LGDEFEYTSTEWRAPVWPKVATSKCIDGLQGPTLRIKGQHGCTSFIFHPLNSHLFVTTEVV
jgi:hypothetical protein